MKLTKRNKYMYNKIILDNYSNHYEFLFGEHKTLQ